ncbi:membrane protein involved in the export of O-antigen and teichoic acid [Xenococcus sp. PCC 7305]|uniref:flippase n=1 Tax=Xenococcus sp. PCC 7305 TaxID=102125 RepID=UPI0002AC8414|nr:flippase [Xenococcus sp. PCC 7305]ELS05481.1 membrane protein involved in the export of O-antigen and teichoic acid [Xenococcus sp. PCC 7305]
MTQTSVTNSTESIQVWDLARDTGVALIIQVGGVSLTYLLQVVLARWMGQAEYGIYEYVMAWSLLLGIFAGLGLARTNLRLISEYRVKEDWGRLRGIFKGSCLIVIVAGCLISLVGTGVLLLIDPERSFTYTTPLLIGVWLIPLQGLVQLQLETSRALEDVTLAYAPYQIVWPVLILCGGLIVMDSDIPITSIPMISLATGLLVVVVFGQTWLVGDKINREYEPAEPIYDYKGWFNIALVLLLQGSFIVLLNQTDVVMVGNFLGPEQAGTYSAAIKTAMLISIILQTVNTVVAPAFVALYYQNDILGLQKVVSTVTAWIFWPSLILGILFMTFSHTILGLFGTDFLAVDWELKILVLGRVLDAVCGSVGCLMIMTGHQNQSVVIFGIAAAINLILNAVLIPIFGSVGAAIATTVSLIMWNIALSILVMKYIGVRSSIFYNLFPKPEVQSTL